MIASRFLVTTAAFALALASPSQRVEAVGEPIADDITLTKRDGIDCGPGDGVWAPGDIFETNVEFFCESLEYTDISDGYAASDTYLIKLSPQNGPAEDGKIIFQIKNDGERPAFHLWDWTENCYNQLMDLVKEGSKCRGEKGDTKGGTNKIGSITFEATVKKGDVWDI